nr:MerR family transcriptional regulator [Cucumibacter marinus]
MNLIDIGEVTRRSGLAASALRYYEELGLIRSVRRRGLRRQYEPDVLLQLDLIGLAREAGFSLADIASMRDAKGRTEFPRDELRRRAAKIESKIRDLEALKDMLLHMADCPAPSHLDCPSFRKLLEGSGR